MTQASKGVLAILAACAIWGIATVYYKTLAMVHPMELLAHRTIWTLVVFTLLLAAQGRLGAVRVLLTGPDRWRVALSAATISFNWGLFIWAVQAGHAIEAGLGYYIFPLMAVCLGVVVLHERLSLWQGIAVGFALLAAAVLTYGLGVAPWVALSLAASFSIYGLTKKRMVAGAAVSITAEVVLIAPFALIWLGLVHLGGWQGGGAFGLEPLATALLPLAGLITGGPLMLFTWGAQRVRLSTLGLVQYLNPTLQVMVAVLLFHEPFTPWHAGALVLIWVALAIYSLESLRQDRAARKQLASFSASAAAAN